MQSNHCPFCDHANPAGAKFCNECGSPLHLAPCKHCDAVNHVDDVQCYRCGASLTSRAAAAAEDTGEDIDEQPVGLDQQARWVEQQILRFDAPPDANVDADLREEPEPGADLLEPEPIEHDLGPLDLAATEGAPERRDAVQSEADSPPPIASFTADQRSAPEPWRGAESRWPEGRGLFSEIVDRPRGRWPEYAGGFSAVLVVLAVIAGGYSYYTRHLATRATGIEAAAPAPTYAQRAEEAVEFPRPERTALVPQAKAVDPKQIGPLPAPMTAQPELAAPDAQAPADPTGSKEETSPASQPVPESAAPQCPPAVAAMALCDWVARADRN